MKKISFIALAVFAFTLTLTAQNEKPEVVAGLNMKAARLLAEFVKLNADSIMPDDYNYDYKVYTLTYPQTQIEAKTFCLGDTIVSFHIYTYDVRFLPLFTEGGYGGFKYYAGNTSKRLKEDVDAFNGFVGQLNHISFDSLQRERETMWANLADSTKSAQREMVTEFFNKCVSATPKFEALPAVEKTETVSAPTGTLPKKYSVYTKSVETEDFTWEKTIIAGGEANYDLVFKNVPIRVCWGSVASILYMEPQPEWPQIDTDTYYTFEGTGPFTINIPPNGNIKFKKIYKFELEIATESVDKL